MSTALTAGALNPAASVVVEACAGSGKTWLLISRILRLLLAGEDPSHILAITFTRKAAQEMQARLAHELRLLATGSEEQVRRFLADRALSDAEIERVLPRARGLFETVLTAQPGVTINTFHGWFLEVLRHAPLSAGVAADSSLAEQTSSLLEEAWQSFADELADAPGSETARHLSQLFLDYGLANTRRLVESFIRHRGEWLAYTRGQRDPVAFALARLREQLGVAPDDDPIARFFAEGGEQEAGFVAQLLAGGTDRQRESAALLARGGRDDADYFAAIRDMVLTQQGTPRQHLAKRAEQRGQRDRFLRLCERIRNVEQALVAARIFRTNVAALHCGVACLERYQALKAERGQIDFTDIETRLWQLLANGEHAEYLQYKLDARYRHVLLDEFQDTNPLQWHILRAWFDASIAADNRPTVFLVGDPKQSIYRFRGAEPRLFDLATAYLLDEHDAERLIQDESRRCAPAIIEAVNRTFAGEAAFAHFRAHTAHDASLAGGVWLLPLAQAASPANAARERLRNPLTEPLTDPHPAQAHEARRLAEALTQLVGRLPVREKDHTRPARWRDVMVLARARTHLAHFEDAFKAAGIPYVSARRGGLLHTLEALDLTALLEFLVTPFADLRLAHVLRTPVFGVPDEDLLRLAGRSERTWWQRLQALVAEGTAGPTLSRAARLLGGWRELTDRLPVHDLLDRIYFEGDVVAAYEAAVPPPLREAVRANLAAFMELALNVQGGRYPSLPKFLEALRALRTAPEEESPDEGVPDAGLDAVQILTVHGAKGLEAPIVCVIDANRVEQNRDGYGVLVDWPPHEPAPRHFSFYTVQDEQGEARAALFREREAFAATENLNLLYVAMTRAKQYLIVSGSGNDKAHDTWYRRLQQALPAAVSDAPPFPLMAPPTANAAAEAVPASPLDEGLRAALAGPNPTGERVSGFESQAQRRGICLHRILECLTAPAGQPDRTALRLELGLDPADFDALWTEAEALVTRPGLARFFDPARYRRACNELAYVNAAGELRRIDRLVEFEDEVWVLDYKMGETPAPEELARVARRYRDQLAEYRAAMEAVYPGRPVRCALIFAGGLLYVMDGP